MFCFSFRHTVLVLVAVESRLQSTNFHEHLRLLQQSVSRRLHPWFEEILPQVRQQDSHQDQEDTKRDLYLPGSIKQAQEEANLQKRRNQRMSMERELMLSRYGFSRMSVQRFDI